MAAKLFMSKNLTILKVTKWKKCLGLNWHFVRTCSKGPDYIIPTDAIRTWLPDGATKIPGSSFQSYYPQSVISFMKESVDKYGDRKAMAAKINNQWVYWSYLDYWNEVNTVAKAFLKLGLNRYHGVCILGFNSPEWCISYLAGIFAGGLSAGIYTTNSPKACHHILNNCGANIAIVENETQLGKILKLKNNLPHLKVIVQYKGKPKHPEVISWGDLLTMGRSLPEDDLKNRISTLAVNQCCTLTYTSGTTGNPKGVMLSHDQVTYMARHCSAVTIKIPYGTERIISYLPLSHITASFGDIFSSIFIGATVYFATPDALKGKLVDILTDVRPTTFIGVPRVYEKIYEKLIEAELNLPWTKKGVFNWAKKRGIQHHTRAIKTGNKSVPLSFYLAKTLVLTKIKKKLGLDRVVYFRCGGASTPNEVREYFMSLDILLSEGYGLSETCGEI